jgi:hypothetical protein
MLYNDLKQITKRSIINAGPRYSPTQDPSAPNLEISTLTDSLLGLINGKPFNTLVQEMHKDLINEWQIASNQLRTGFPKKLYKPLQLENLLKKIYHLPIDEDFNDISKISKCISKIEHRIEDISNSLWEKEDIRIKELKEKEKKDSTEITHELDDSIREIRNKRHYLNNYSSVITKIANFINSPAYKFKYNNCALLLGAWGTGKTHYLCAYSKKLLNRNTPVLLLLAKDFKPSVNIGQSIADHLNLGITFEVLLRKLNAIGMRKHERVLIIIDGINERDKEVWKKGLLQFIKIIKKYKYVGLILSCRQPFEEMIFTGNLIKQLIDIYHYGFNEIEFDAQTVFFQYYEIPLPEIPLLSDEFSRPLTLKILCEAFTKLPKKTQRQGFSGVASGQKGMNFILEHFIKKRASNIENELALPKNFCWSLIKGDKRIKPPERSGIAPYMAKNGKAYIPKEVCIGIIKNRAEIKYNSMANLVYNRLISEGIIVEDIYKENYDDDEFYTSIRMPYERFSDHIIARSLLSNYLNNSSEDTIRRSFYSNRRLGKIFSVNDPFMNRFFNNGWAEAIIVEFPEFVKKTLPQNSKELFYYLPIKNRSLHAYFEPFVNGLFWRGKYAICKQTFDIINLYLKNYDDFTLYNLLNAIVAVSTKYDFPINGKSLYSFISQRSITNRDLFWSEFLRKETFAGTLERILRWYEHQIPKGIKEESAFNQIIIISLFLTSTNHNLRLRATKALVILGEKFPLALFNHTIMCLKFNDPYVPERMLAACCGVSMSLRKNTEANTFHNKFFQFVKLIIKETIIPSGCLLTHNILIRNYITFLVEFAQKYKPRCIATKHVNYFKNPLLNIPKLFPSYSYLKKKKFQNADFAIHMDFGNYTIGYLIPGRSNYDMSHLKYQKVRKQIEWRIEKLGYKKENFENIDSSISSRAQWRNQNNSGKIDRYGKKYSLIAYYEMYGFLLAKGELSEDENYLDKRDIDPSFPINPPDWTPQLKKILFSKYSKNRDWLFKGPEPKYQHLLSYNDKNNPWTLLNGYIKEMDKNTKRQVFTFIRAFIIDEKHIITLKKLFNKIDHPGNGLPNISETYSTYAGEIPWSSNFVTWMRKKTGKIRDAQSKAFSESYIVTRKKKLNKTWKILFDRLGPNFKYHKANKINFLKEENSELSRMLKELSKIENENKDLDKIEIKDIYWEMPTFEEVQNGYKYVNVYKQTPGVPIESCAYSYNWSQDDIYDNIIRFNCPSLSICDFLNLYSINRSIDFYDSQISQATMYRAFESDSLNFNFLYLREDLLDKYLKYKGKKLVYIIWGERELHYSLVENLRNDSDISKGYQAGKHIHKKMVVL